MQEPQPGLVGQGGMSAGNDFNFTHIVVNILKTTYIFCETSAPLRFFSYWESMACCSCLTSFACRHEREIRRLSVSFDCANDLFNGKLFIGLDLDLSGLFKCLLLDERDLISTRGSEIDRYSKANGVKRTILFISVRTSSSFIGREAIVTLSW
jgi:hypothetical protein